ncbi:DMT family transporter [uncultured Flavonifractor sp.]|uniref:DMT family transporter n=1 Tax=uncultured Flavonifractor sp. TaxID=1193534 RepID=UPI001747E067|nr:DMT family transporter [uncultured Flavonifractor sp.]
MRQTAWTGHGAALLTILIWGTTFISTKVLLTSFQPVEILFLRFVLGFLALCLIYPRRLRLGERRQELWFAAAGLCGVTLYYLLENIALTYTLASNVGVLVSVSPVFTALFSHFLLRREKLRPAFFAGLVVALAGVVLLSYNGSAVLKLDPRGDVLALLAAAIWSAYSLITRHISSFGYPVVQTTRRIFAYGLVFMLPALLIFGFRPSLAAVLEPVNLLNLVYLGLGACALCFVTWNFAVGKLGAVKTSTYIYLVPVVTLATSALVLGEPVTPLSAVGAALTVAGLALSEHKKGTAS